MKVEEVMNQKVKKISPERSIREAARVMHRDEVGSLLVVSEKAVHGILTERDILNTVAEGEEAEKPVQGIMSEDVVTVEPEIPLEEAAEVMVKERIKRVPVVKDDELVGIVTASDLIEYEDKLVEKLSKAFMLPKALKKGKGKSIAG